VYISSYCQQAPSRRILLNLAHEVNSSTKSRVKFLVNRFRDYGVLTPPKLPFPIDLLHRPYNSVCSAMRHFYDLLLSIIRPSRIGPYPSNKCVHRHHGSQTFLQITLENMWTILIILFAVKCLYICEEEEWDQCEEETFAMVR